VVGTMTTTERPKMTPIVCTPWCQHNDGHTGSLVREEQTCWGPADYVELSRERATQDVPDVCVPRIGARAYRQWPGESPCVYVHLEDIWVPPNRGGDCLLDDQLRLSGDEAIKLAHALITAAGLIDPRR
jgi:hypothetical protein